MPADRLRETKFDEWTAIEIIGHVARGGTRRLEMVHLLAVEALLEGNRGGRIAELPNGGKVRRRQGWLELDVEND